MKTIVLFESREIRSSTPPLITLKSGFSKMDLINLRALDVRAYLRSRVVLSSCACILALVPPVKRDRVLLQACDSLLKCLRADEGVDNRMDLPLNNVYVGEVGVYPESGMSE